jgi:hypothetical protein
MGGFLMTKTRAYTFSVLIGRASTEDCRRIFECLQALREQEGVKAHEVIIADRRNDNISVEIAREYPEVKLISCEEDTTLPQLLTLALWHATGEFVVVTEDHCVPRADWFSNICDAFERAPSQTVAVGGCVENGLPHTNFDWATFLCEYCHFLYPVPEGETEVLAGVNIAYRKTVLDELPEGALNSGFWETNVHPALRKRGYTLYSSNDIMVYHRKNFSLKLFVTQRFQYSRHYAGTRFERDQLAVRVMAALFCPLLPALLLLRMMSSICKKRRMYSEFIFALPYLVIFVSIWAFGEFWGYLFGAGDTLAAIE